MTKMEQRSVQRIRPALLTTALSVIKLAKHGWILEGGGLGREGGPTSLISIPPIRDTNLNRPPPWIYPNPSRAFPVPLLSHRQHRQTERQTGQSITHPPLHLQVETGSKRQHCQGYPKVSNLTLGPIHRKTNSSLLHFSKHKSRRDEGQPSCRLIARRWYCPLYSWKAITNRFYLYQPPTCVPGTCKIGNFTPRAPDQSTVSEINDSASGKRIRHNGWIEKLRAETILPPSLREADIDTSRKVRLKETSVSIQNPHPDKKDWTPKLCV